MFASWRGASLAGPSHHRAAAEPAGVHRIGVEPLLAPTRAEDPYLCAQAREKKEPKSSARSGLTPSPLPSTTKASSPHRAAPETPDPRDHGRRDRPPQRPPHRHQHQHGRRRPRPHRPRRHNHSCTNTSPEHHWIDAALGSCRHRAGPPSPRAHADTTTRAEAALWLGNGRHETGPVQKCFRRRPEGPPRRRE